ncbi:MAG: S49 family peptidase [Ignavibacteriota bacterium]
MLKGLRAELMYFKKSLDKLGVSVDVEHAGKYKDFGDMFTRSDMSTETREVMDSVVDGDLRRAGGPHRRGPQEKRRRGAQHHRSGPLHRYQAQKVGLVDDLRFEDEMWSELKNKLHGGDVHHVSMDDYLRRAARFGRPPGQDAHCDAGGARRHCARQSRRQRVGRIGTDVLRLR